jgi:hypothetical protein
MKQFSNANHMYADAFEDYFVPIKTAHGTRGSGYWPWHGNAAFADMLGLAGSGAWRDWPDGLYCPNLPDRIVGNEGRCYAWNHYNNDQNGWTDKSVIKRVAVKGPAQKLQMVDANDWHVSGPYRDLGGTSPSRGSRSGSFGGGLALRPLHMRI